MTAARLIVWRHGETDWNRTGRFQGQVDIPLNALGRAQARVAAEVLASYDPVALWSSDLVRTTETAAALSALTGLPMQTDARLREIHVGSWEGLTGTEVALADPEPWARLHRGEDVRRSATGESVAEVGERVASALTEIGACAPGDATVVVTCHGTATRAGIAHLLGLPSAHAFGSLSNCAWAVLRWHRGAGAYRLAEYNVAGPATVRETIS